MLHVYSVITVKWLAGWFKTPKKRKDMFWILAAAPRNDNSPPLEAPTFNNTTIIYAPMKIKML